MRSIAGKCDELRFGEDRPRYHPVWEMVTSCAVRRVQEKNVTFVNIDAKSVEYRANCETPSARMYWNSVGLRKYVSQLIGYEARKVVGMAEDRTAGRSQHDPTHVLAYVIQPIL